MDENQAVSSKSTAIERFMTLPIIIGDYFATGEGVTMFVLFDTNTAKIDDLINTVPEYFRPALKKMTLKAAFDDPATASVIERIAPELYMIAQGKRPVPGQLNMNVQMHLNL